MLGDGRGDRYNVDISGFEVVRVASVAQTCGFNQQFIFNFQCGIVVTMEFVNSALVDVEADYIAFFTEFYGQGEALIHAAKAVWSCSAFTKAMTRANVLWLGAPASKSPDWWRKSSFAWPKSSISSQPLAPSITDSRDKRMAGSKARDTHQAGI